MAVHFTRPATVVALALSVGLLALPACKKKKVPPPADTPAQNTSPPPTSNPDPMANAGGPNLPPPPRAPIFRGQNPRLAVLRGAAENNMRVIVRAIHDFEAAHQALPAGYADKTGKPGLSWRVAILPYIEQDPLFKRFKLDEPWDGPNNIKLIELMPKLFAPPNESTYGYTFARGFSGPNTWLAPQQAGRPAQAGQLLLGARIANITDGLSNTALVADAADAVIWTKPEEMAFAPNSVPKTGGVFEGQTIVGLGDGTVKLIRKNADPGLMPKLIQINDGQVVQFDD